MNFTLKFDSVTGIHVMFIDQFKEQVPSTINFSIGYYGAQQTKVWLVLADDLSAIYSQHINGGTITLWCDGRLKEDNQQK